MKLGNTSFNPEAFADVSFDEFVKGYAGKLQGYDIGEAYKALTGRNPVLSNKDGKDSEPVKEVRSVRPSGKRSGSTKGK